MNKKHRKIVHSLITDNVWTGPTDAQGNPVVTLDGITHSVLELLLGIDPQTHHPENGNLCSLDPDQWQPNHIEVSDESVE